MPKAWKKWLVIGLLVAGLAAIFYLVFRGQLHALNVKTVAIFLRRLGPWAAILGGTLIVLQTFFPVIPFLVLAGANVLVFGLWGGFFINWISAEAGSILMFYIARTAGREWAERKISKLPKVESVNQFLRKNSFKTILTLRLFPVIPPAVVNLASGLASVPTRAFIWATVVGKIPAIFVESLIGHDLLHFGHHKTRLLIMVIALVVILGVGIRLLKKKVS
jgi:uncharacterized membrane protein YdjX (TVP38/TMEM64 family)